MSSSMLIFLDYLRRWK